VTRVLVHRPGFTDDLLQFDGASIKQILDKCTMLQASPEEEGKAKARLDGRIDGLHRLRSGDFRVFYTFDDDKVSLWAVRRKTVKGQYRGKKGGDVTYNGLDEVEDDDVDLEIPGVGAASQGFREWVRPRAERTPLPEAITVELLGALQVPATFHARLLPTEDQESLLDCPGVPAEFLLAIDRHMFEEPIDLRGEQPELYAPGGVEDLLRFTEGKVVPFLLRLSLEQEKYVRWALDAGGPTLVKGGPGTGKSTVALYRVREMVPILRAAGVENPTILFTTYTNALVTFSTQLLRSLLGDDFECVHVRTVDKVVNQVLRVAGESMQRPDARARSRIEGEALDAPAFDGNALRVAAQRQSLGRLGRDYVFEEIRTIVHGRDLHTLDGYLAARRPGRQVPLGETQRRSIWAVATTYDELLAKAGYRTWEQARSRAADLAAGDAPGLPRYDAVVIDEAQDLDAGALRLLVRICAAPNRLFLTADESQAIYAAGFGWSDVHDQLKFRGRTGVLRANHRSTRQIAEAAHDYLAAGLADELVPDQQTYVHEGALPAVRAVADRAAEVDLVARYLRGASHALRLTIGSGAVLVPDRYSGEPLAAALNERVIPAVYRDSREFELDDNSITVLPFVAAKGLEFPIVAVAGFRGSNFPHIPADAEPEAQVDLLVRARRTLFVCMTRAMRALLVVTPMGDDSMLYDGFDPRLWNTE
jgi:superfamily I DNA/RNA helicase/mRNA-degrading endonuclease RelE of RelBE toxin-antitoxin system